VSAMSNERPTLKIDGDDDTIVHVGCVPSGRRAIITIASPRYRNARQAVLTVEQAARLGRFLSEGPDAGR
jgi:hypothetical protein